MNTKNPEKFIILALDGMTKKEALKTALKFRGRVWGFKITDLLYEKGIICELKKFGKVFADAKLNDIPKTVENETRSLSKAGADFISVHASGGAEMMRAAKKNCGKAKIIAVTVLTSLDDKTRVLFGRSVRTLVGRLTEESRKAGVGGIVCSGRESKNIKGSAGFIKVVTAIRPDWYMWPDDQKRTVRPKDAVKAGADFLVIGRPIISDRYPLKALEKIKEEIKNL